MHGDVDGNLKVGKSPTSINCMYRQARRLAHRRSLWRSQCCQNENDCRLDIVVLSPNSRVRERSADRVADRLSKGRGSRWSPLSRIFGWSQNCPCIERSRPTVGCAKPPSALLETGTRTRVDTRLDGLLSVADNLHKKVGRGILWQVLIW